MDKLPDSVVEIGDEGWRELVAKHPKVPSELLSFAEQHYWTVFKIEYEKSIREVELDVVTFDTPGGIVALKRGG